MKKRIIALTLSVIMATSLAACGNPGNSPMNSDTPEAPVEESPEISDMNDASSIQSQLELLAANYQKWKLPDEIQNPLYAVADLDDNGRLEVMTTFCEGTGLYSHNKFYEVGEDYSSVQELEYNLADSEDEPDISYDIISTYKGDPNSYVFSDVIHINAAESMVNNYDVTKSGNEIIAIKLNSLHSFVNEEGDLVEKYYDISESEIDVTAYYNYEMDYFSEKESTYTYFGWGTPESEAHVLSFLEMSYKTFVSGAVENAEPYTVTVYLDNTAEPYLNLGDNVEKLDGVPDPETTVRFVCDQDDIMITLEYGEWIDSMNFYFHPISEIFNITTEAGKVYEFPATLPEGMPYYRLKAQRYEECCLFYLGYDGYGDSQGVFEISYEESQPIQPFEDDAIMSLCKAYAGAMITAGNDVALEQNYMWQTVANAAMLQTLKFADVDAEGQIYLTEWMMEKYINAMFPYIGLLPEMPENGPVIYDPTRYERYVIKDALYYDDSSTEIADVQYDEFGNILVTVSVATQMGYEGVVIYLMQDNAVVNENPFGYIITGAEINAG